MIARFSGFAEFRRAAIEAASKLRARVIDGDRLPAQGIRERITFDPAG